MTLVGWLFKCYRKYIYIRVEQIVVASVSRFCMVASNIFSIIIAVFVFPHIQKFVTVHMFQAESAG